MRSSDRRLILVVPCLLLSACASSPTSSSVATSAGGAPPFASAVEAPGPDLGERAPSPERLLPESALELPQASAGTRSQGTRPDHDQPVWSKGQGLVQGWLGVTQLTSSSRSGGDVAVPPEGSVDLGNLPVIGGGGQWKLAGEDFDFGLEAGLNFGFSSSGGAFATGSGGAVVAVSIDTLLLDLYGGPFISKFLGRTARIYASAGPLLQWASFDQESDEFDYSGSGTGFGVGWYVRAGLEFQVGPMTLVGIGGRWFDSEIDLSGGLGDWDLRGAQLLFTVTRSL